MARLIRRTPGILMVSMVSKEGVLPVQAVKLDVALLLEQAFGDKPCGYRLQQSESGINWLEIDHGK